MSHAHRRNGTPSAPRNARRHEEEEAMDVDDEGEMEEDDGFEAFTKGSQVDIAEKLVLHLETHPEDPEARAMVQFFIRKLYVSSGGLPFDKTNPIPFDLDACSTKELTNVLENMIIFAARTRQKELVTKAMNTCANLGYIFAGKENGKVFEQINSDTVLRNSLFEVFLGSKFSPLLAVLISGSSYITNLWRNYVDNGKPGVASGESNSSAPTTTAGGVPSNASNKPSV